MCFTLSANIPSKNALETKFGAKFPPSAAELKPRYVVSGFSLTDCWVLSMDQPDTFQKMDWGLIPHWTSNQELAKEFRINHLNAKAETALEKPAFREAILKQRCLIPVTGFFEWRTLGKKKYPYHIQLKQEEIFCFAGIYDHWTDPITQNKIAGFSILTTEANPLMEKIHNQKKRMPCILSIEVAQDWIKKTLQVDDFQYFLKPFPENLMKAYTIGNRITSRKENPDVPESLLAFDYPEIALFDLF